MARPSLKFVPRPQTLTRKRTHVPSTTSVLSVHNNFYSPWYCITFCLTKAGVDRPKCRTNSVSWCWWLRETIFQVFFPSKMSIKSVLKSSYGPKVVNLISRYERCRERTARFRNHVVFALRCKQEGIIPRSLDIRPPINTEQGRRIARRAGHQFLRERLRLSNFKLRELEEERKWREIGIRRMVSEEDYERIEKMTNESAEFEFIRTKDRQMRKFSKLQGVRRAPETAT